LLDITFVPVAEEDFLESLALRLFLSTQKLFLPLHSLLLADFPPQAQARAFTGHAVWPVPR
jgi:hypothetical protein